MVIRKNLDVPYDLSLVIDNIEVLHQIEKSQNLIFTSLVIDNIEVLHQIEKSQNLIFTPLLNNEEYLNLTN